MCAQPDDFYFSWQIELLVINLNHLGVKRDKIHILLAYDKLAGKNMEFSRLIKNYKDKASFYYYLDTRQESKYISSIRPHILGKHFKKFAFLKNETIFYHDSDILFKDVKVFNMFRNSECCIVSDTRNYLDYDYVINSSSYSVLQKMAKIVGISAEQINENKHNSGGAQYILNNIDFKFWNKVEKDCEEIFEVLKGHNDNLWIGLFENEVYIDRSSIGIQAWCADMWAILYNLWYYNRKVEIHPILDFVWPDSPILEWNNKHILHYSGAQGIDTNFFRKTIYRFYPPWNDPSLTKIPNTNCSSIVKKYVELRNEQTRKNVDLFENFIIVLKNNSKKPIKQNTYRIVSLIYYDTILSTGGIFFDAPNSHEQLEEILQLKKKLIVISDNVILKSNDLKNLIAVVELRKLFGTKCKLQVNRFELDSLLLDRFKECLDTNFLDENKGKASFEPDELEVTIIDNLVDLDKLGVYQMEENVDFHDLNGVIELEDIDIFTYET